jgi:sterol 3beta-glucosyltransferase
MAVLGRALKDEGYDVSVAAPENFRGLIENMGLEFRRCGADFSAFMKDEERNMLAGARSNVRQVLAWRFPPARARSMFDGVLRDAVVAAADADAIVFHPFVSVASDIAEAKNIPAILVPLAFVSPSDETPLAMLPRPGKPRWNRMSYGFLRLQRTAFSRTIQELRASLGLKKAFRYVHPHHVRGSRVPVLFPVSPLLRPRAARSGGDDIHFTGYWFRDEDPGWRPTGALATFLGSGEQPIYIGFGSMPGIGPDRTAMLLAALEAANVRAILGKGWGSFGDASTLPRNVHVLDYAPHEHLFPLVKAVVHHGGLGTVSTGLRAGKPTLVCPFMLDQAYWGHRVAQLGVGPEPLPISSWTREALTAALRDLCENPLYRMHADAAGVEMRQEDGPATAAKVVRDIVGGLSPTSTERPANRAETEEA